MLTINKLIIILTIIMMIIIITMIIIIMYKENKREFKNYEAIMIPTVKDNFTAFNLLIIW